jgi:rRNA maturation endonuclease Nob1
MTIEGLDSSGLGISKGPIFRFRCAGCSYGASRATVPDRCPMCGGAEWDHETWRPFSRLVSDLSMRTEDPRRALH